MTSVMHLEIGSFAELGRIDGFAIRNEYSKQGALAMIDSGFHDVLGQAKKLLAESPFDELRRIRVERCGDEIELQGQVHSFYLKQLAQETVRTATRGIQVVNSLGVD